MLAETVVLATSSSQITVLAVANLLSSIPFIAVLVGGGYWLSTGGLEADRYARIGAWTLGGTVFLGGFFTLVATFTPGGLPVRVGIVRWGIAAGAGSGALVGIFEGRAIERAIAAERTTVRNEELKRQNDRLEEFANIVSHDLRNPLNVANGYVEILREEYGNGDFDQLVAAHSRMERIIEDLLLLARSGQLIDEAEAVPLSTLVERSWASVDTREATLETERMSPIIADADRVQHLLENLFRNAVEHGGDDVTIRVGMVSNGFYVEDDGPGIPEEDRETVLEMGYSTSPDGTGFGLAIVRQIADAHTWGFSVAEGIDGGARFEITGVDLAPSRGAEPSTPTADTRA